MACGGDTANSNANSNRSLVNTALNTAGNAVNTVANAVSNVTNTNTASKEPDFMKEAAQGGMAEVELGKLAVSKAQNPEVKKYGQMMVTDHTKANDELKALAAKKNYTLPSDIGSNKSTVEKLSSLSGADFDKAYVKDMVEDHETDVAAFQKQADSATDPDIKAFAAKTLPVLKKHLDAIKAIQAKMK
jgi:putative membrane protein